MSNEWNNLSENFENRQKHIASIKLKKKTPIYKHVVIKKTPKKLENPEVEIKNEFFLLPEPESQRSKSICVTKFRNVGISGFQQTNQSYFDTNIRENSIEAGLLKRNFDLPNYLINSRITLGKKLYEKLKIELLTEISKKVISSEDSSTKFKTYYNDFERTFNVVCYGENAPWSECCKMHIIIQFSNDFGGKVLCPHRNCVIQCLSNFFISKENRDLLWIENEKKILTNKAVVRTNADFKYKIHEFTADSLYFTDGKTLTAPKDIFSAFIDPLQQILKSHRKLKH